MTHLRPLLIMILLLASAACRSDSGSPYSAPIEAIDISTLDFQVVREPALFWTTGEELSVDQLPLAAFEPLTARQLNRGVTADYHWIRMRLSNAEGEQDQHWILRHETSYLDELVVYYADNNGTREREFLSDRVAFGERPIQYRTLAFAHTTPAGGFTDLWLRLHFKKTDTLTLNLFLSEAGVFHAQSRLEHLIYGSYYGLMAALLVIAIIFAVILRHAVYLHYAIFLCFSSLTWALLNGFAFQYLWPGSVFWHNEGFHIVYLLMAITALQFSRGFLKTAEYFPRINTFIKVYQWFLAGGILLRFGGIYEPVLYLSFFALASLILLAPLGLMAYRKGLRYARWYSGAWVFYGVGLLASVISAGTRLFDWGMSPLAYAQAGGALEAVFLLIALGEKLIGWDRDRRLALQVANQDPLTGLGNRRALTDAFERFRDRFATRRTPVYLIMIDLDHFKEINDRYGHDAGDQVLQHMGRLLREASRPEDVCVRFGGEEFAVLLQAPSLTHALEIAERIRSDFTNSPTLYNGEVIEHTLTAGITEVSPGSSLSRTEMIKQADTALYAAKSAGRNQTQVYGQA